MFFVYLCKHEIVPQPSKMSSNLHRRVSALFEAHGPFSILLLSVSFKCLGRMGGFSFFLT